LLVLRVMAQVQPGAEAWAWGGVLNRCLQDKELAVRRAAVAAVKGSGLKNLGLSLLDLSRQPSEPIDLRIAALECHAERNALDGDSVDLLRDHLGDKTDPLVRLAAARTLGVAKLNSEQLQRVANMIPGVSTMVLRQLLAAFAQSNDANVGKALVIALEKNAAAESLNVAELDRALKRQPPEVVEFAGALRKKLAARQENQAAYLAGIKKELADLKPNPNLGRFVFASQKAACAACHRVEGKGGQIGPDLSKIGLFRSRDEILESIVFPSHTIAPEYRTFQVQTKDGNQTTGLITWETPDAITLRTAQLTEVRIARKDIDELLPATVSLMPDGLERMLNRQELCDLVEFLVQRK
jgi:putative heme-binding domain-containing protein